MPGGQLLDSIVAFVLGVVSGGYTRLSPELRNLLSLLVGLEFMIASLAWMAASLGFFTLFVSKTIRMCIFVFLFVNIALVTQVVLEFTIWGGLELAGVASNGQLTPEEFQHPSIVADMGFRAIAPIMRFMRNHTGLGALYNLPTLLLMLIPTVFIWVFFMITALHLVLVLFAAYVLGGFMFLTIPFGAFGPLAFVAERGIGMFVAAAFRLGVLAFFTALIFPFVEGFFLPPNAAMPGQPDPGVAEAWWLLLGSALFALVSIVIPSIVSGLMSGTPILSMGNLIPGAAVVTPTAPRAERRAA